MDKRLVHKWDPTNIHAHYFSIYGADYAKLHKRSLFPLGQKPLQEKEFEGTVKTKGYFSSMGGSII